MLSTFDQLTKYIKSFFIKDNKSDKYMEKKIPPKTDDIEDDCISLCSLTLDLPLENNFSENEKSIKTGYIKLFITPILYFTFNISLIIIELYLLHTKGFLLKHIDYFSISEGNMLIYEIYHIVSLLLGLMIVLILHSTFHERLSKEKSFKVKALLDFLVTFGILFNLFDISNCAITLYSSKNNIKYR